MPSPLSPHHSCKYGQCSRYIITTRIIGTFSQSRFHIQLAPEKYHYHETSPHTVEPNTEHHCIQFYQINKCLYVNYSDNIIVYINHLAFNSTKLRYKLGPWTTSPSTFCTNHLHQQALYIQHSDGLWYQHLRSTSQYHTRASPLPFKTAGCTQQQLPIGATIVDVRKEGGKYI